MSSENLPQFKKFVTESELEDKRKQRQEEWEKVRRPEQPIEAPEEEYDSRSLYDRLQEQKNKKQEEFDDLHKLKNQVRGLDRDETDFLDFVSDRQMQLDQERKNEEEEMLKEFRSQQNIVNSTTLSAKLPSKQSGLSTPLKQTTTSQAALLAGAIKRKRNSSDSPTDTKKLKETAEEESSTKNVSSDKSDMSSKVQQSEVSKTHTDSQVAKVIGILPGIGGVYSDSDNSDSSSSDSEIDTDVFRRALPKGLEKAIQAAQQQQ